MTADLLAAARACTPAACTWGEMASQYTTKGFAVGLPFAAAAVLLLWVGWRRVRGRRGVR
jgi:hypothetical protein